MKKSLGQYYTVEYDYILDGFAPHLASGPIIEPFVGCGHLIEWYIKSGRAEQIEAYDIEPKLEEFVVSNNTIKRDTLADPPMYEGKIVITNPPYLSRNKSRDKTLFNKFKLNDLYKIFIHQMIEGGAAGGIVIIPLNFFCSIRKADQKLRRQFLDKYEILAMNIFEEPVFADTTYTVCSFVFTAGPQSMPIEARVFPSKQTVTIDLNIENNFLFGGEIYNIKKDPRFKVSRLLIKVAGRPATNLKLYAIDSSAYGKPGTQPIRLVIGDHYCGKSTDRAFATLVVHGPDDFQIKPHEAEVCRRFNTLLTDLRRQYLSMFLSTFRNANRKRISFTLVYNLVSHILGKIYDEI